MKKWSLDNIIPPSPLASLSIALLMLFPSLPGHAGQDGNGGGGLSILFTNLGKRFHREILIIPREDGKEHPSDLISPPKFLATVDGTKVVFTNEHVYDRHGDVSTARYYPKSEVDDLYRARGMSIEEITEALATMPYGMIEVNIPRFSHELSKGMVVAMHLAAHEYFRAMNLTETNYMTLTKYFNQQFFNELYLHASLSTKLQLDGRHKSFMEKVKLIDAEETRLRDAVITDMPIVLNLLVQMEKLGVRLEGDFNALIAAISLDLSNASNFVGSGASLQYESLDNTFGILTKHVSLQTQKTKDGVTELNGLKIQVDYLKNNIHRNIRFLREIEDLRRMLVMEHLSIGPAFEARPRAIAPNPQP